MQRWLLGNPPSPPGRSLQRLRLRNSFSPHERGKPAYLSRSQRLKYRGALQPCYWRFEFEANAFLHHMIRNIMGCLVAIGRGDNAPEWIDQVLSARSRNAAAPTFSPDGLYFLGPVYDAAWGLPQRTAAYDWLP